ncbi:hypothetical protein [Oceanibium sediminis]|uniref:hypothetical protein n=1 Tax=Oceanibium sediminis TaxID=2026339 RepID=UPI000DD4DE2A|nr:hypothetical protein [Oceanibium sediminis]
MQVVVVEEQNFNINEPPTEIIFDKHSDHVPSVGDIIKVGHNLNGFKTYNVERRVFRQLPTRDDNPEAFQAVIVLVSEI